MNFLLDFIIIGGIIISAQILFILIKDEKKELPQWLLILFFETFFFYFLTVYALLHRIVWLYAVAFIFSDVIEIFIGPLLLIYIKSLFEDNVGLVKKHLFHFIPTGLHLVFISIPYLITEVSESHTLEYYIQSLSVRGEFIDSFLLIYLIFYLLFTNHLFFKYSKAITSVYSNITSKDYAWIKSMLLGLIAIAIIDLCFKFCSPAVEYYNLESDYITAIFVVVLIVHLGYYGVNQSKILLPDFLIKNKPATNKINQLSNTSKDEIEMMKAKIVTVLKEQKPYLDEDLTLRKLAELIPTTDKKLSTILNQHMGTTFYDIVNSYRLEEVKQKIASEDSQQYSIIGLAFECGFKSKTSFYRIFKQETGRSPSEYKKSLLDCEK